MTLMTNSVTLTELRPPIPRDNCTENCVVEVTEMNSNESAANLTRRSALDALRHVTPEHCNNVVTYTRFKFLLVAIDPVV